MFRKGNCLWPKFAPNPALWFNKERLSFFCRQLLRIWSARRAWGNRKLVSNNFNGILREKGPLRFLTGSNWHSFLIPKKDPRIVISRPSKNPPRMRINNPRRITTSWNPCSFLIRIKFNPFLSFLTCSTFCRSWFLLLDFAFDPSYHSFPRRVRNLVSRLERFILPSPAT